MSRTSLPSIGKHYGLACVCAAWKFPRSTRYAQRNRSDDPVPPGKRGPETPFTDAELTVRHPTGSVDAINRNPWTA